MACDSDGCQATGVHGWTAYNVARGLGSRGAGTGSTHLLSSSLSLRLLHPTEWHHDDGFVRSNQQPPLVTNMVTESVTNRSLTPLESALRRLIP